MTAKFIPFDPKTAKNGDIVYGVLTGTEYRYVGKHPINNDRVITYRVSERHLGFEIPENLCIKQPMKTVWINLYNAGQDGYWYTSEQKALAAAPKHSDNYIGTFPLEIPA